MLRHVKQIRVAFSPFDRKSRSAREFLRQVSARRMRATNPKAVVETVVREDYGENTVDIEFTDGQTLSLGTCNMIVNEIIEEIDLVNNQIDS